MRHFVLFVLASMAVFAVGPLRAQHLDAATSGDAHAGQPSTRYLDAATSGALADQTGARHIALQLEGTQDDLLGLFLPKIAVAADGSYGIVAEGLFRTDTGREVSRVIAQRYSPTGASVGSTHIFAGESCSSLDLWDSDYMARPEIAFHPGGSMLVLMQHTGQYVVAADAFPSSEITLGAIDGSGRIVDLSGESACVQHKFYFSGGGRQDRPRFEVTSNGEIFVTADGFFNGSSARNVAIKVLDAAGNEAVDQVIPHTDTDSQHSFHQHPDIATNGSLILSTWHRCSWDNEGNTDECDVEAQFAGVTQQGLQAVGVNQRVNAGDPAGTVNIWASAAMNASGQSVVAWADARDGAAGDIYAQRFNASGQPVGGNIRVSTGQGAIDERPEVAVLAGGRFAVVWSDSSAASYRARARIFDAAGTPESAPFELVPGSVSGQPGVAADGSTFAYVYLTLQGGSTSIASSKAVSGTATEALPGGFHLHGAHPNPFVDDVQIGYDLPAARHVVVRLFDVLGREVDRLLDGTQPAGTHTVRFDGSALTPGLYLVEMQAGTERHVLTVVRAK